VRVGAAIDDDGSGDDTHIDAHQWDIKSFDIDDERIYTSSYDYCLKIWDNEDSEEKEIIKVLKEASKQIITKLIIYKDYIITSSMDKKIVYRDKVTGRVLKSIENGSGVTTMYMDEEHLIAGFMDGTLKVFDKDSAKVIKILENGHNDAITSIITTDDYIISGSKDKNITMWKYYE